jgi:hypothetical protein
MIVRSEEAKTEKKSDILYLVALGAVPGVGLLLWAIAIFLL